MTLSLPLLEAILPRSARAAAEPARRRMVLIDRPLGTYHPYLVPEKAGPNCVATPYRQQMGVETDHFGSSTGVLSEFG